jgi:hypothetical protein
MPAQLDDEELADWRAGRAALYQLAALTVGGRRRIRNGPRGAQLRPSPLAAR